MPNQTMLTQPQRVGLLKADILPHVMFQEVIGKFGLKKPMPRNVGETQIFRRWLPKGATAASPNTWNIIPNQHQLSEGETPVAEAITAQDISVTLVEYGFIYRWSNRVEDLYEDDVPAEFKKLVGDRMGGLMEMIRWGQLKACTNVFYPGGVSTRVAVVAALSANVLRRVSRSLQLNQAKKITGILDASDGVGTQPVEAAYVVICHTDNEFDIRQLAASGSAFIHVSEYGRRQTIHENELGSWENFRFITSPHLNPTLSVGGAVSSTFLAGGVPGNGALPGDIYSLLVLAEDCFGDVALRGKNAMKVNSFQASAATKEDVLGQRGSIGAQTYFACVRLNDLQMAVIECACTALT